MTYITPRITILLGTVFLALFSVSVCYSFGKGYGLETLFQTPKVNKVFPGQSLSITTLVTNNTDQDCQVVWHLDTPNNWQVTTADIDIFYLPAKNTRQQNFILSIPQDVQESEYVLTYFVESQNNPELRDQDEITLVIENSKS